MSKGYTNSRTKWGMYQKKGKKKIWTSRRKLSNGPIHGSLPHFSLKENENSLFLLPFLALGIELSLLQTKGGHRLPLSSFSFLLPSIERGSDNSHFAQGWTFFLIEILRPFNLHCRGPFIESRKVKEGVRSAANSMDELKLTWWRRVEPLLCRGSCWAGVVGLLTGQNVGGLQHGVDAS